MTMPQTIPASAANTAAWKLKDDAFIFPFLELMPGTPGGALDLRSSTLQRDGHVGNETMPRPPREVAGGHGDRGDEAFKPLQLPRANQ